MTTSIWKGDELEVTRLWGGVRLGIAYQFTPIGTYGTLTRDELVALTKALIIELGKEALK